MLFFNNSLLTRSALFRGSPGPPITSYNNAVMFIGCGKDGEVSCRQVFECADSALWTEDRSALFLTIRFPLDKDGMPIDHRMRFNAYNRALDVKIGKIDQERVSAPVRFDGAVPSGMVSAVEIERIFAVGPESPLAHAGCQLRYAKGDLTCIGSGAPVGAMLPNGKRFDRTNTRHFTIPSPRYSMGHQARPDRNNQSGRTVSRKYLAVLSSNSPNHRE